MKYKVGDKVMVKAKITDVICTGYKVIAGGYGFFVTERQVCDNSDMTADEAWEIAGRILEMERHEIMESILEGDSMYPYRAVFHNLTPQEAKAKIEAWKEQKEIKVGDVVKVDSKNALVMRIDGGEECIMLFENGDSRCIRMNALKKTGRHIDIEGMLKQIGGDE